MDNRNMICILSHHKCATNWLRAICNNLVKKDVAQLEVVGGKTNGADEADDVQKCKILLNVNAGGKAGERIVYDPNRNLHFVRDPRDALVSNYFSWRYSHKPTNERLIEFRDRSEEISVEEGMIELVEMFPMGSQLAAWPEALWKATTQIRYEDMLTDFDGTFREMFAHSGIELTDGLVAAIKEQTDFRKMSKRDDGSEDVTSHFRKGQSGDWSNHFTDRLSEAFFAKHGWLGERLGYW